MVLIHWPLSNIKPVGGPAGYLFGLKNALDAMQASNYSFIDDGTPRKNIKHQVWDMAPNRLKEAFLARKYCHIETELRPDTIGYEKFDAIHFHSTIDLYRHRKALEGYQGKLVLTSHTPCVSHKELVSALNPKDAKRHADELKGFAVIDEYSFARADYVVFPCPAAEEPYFHTWGEYAKVRDEAKMRYLPTGIAKCEGKVGRSEIRDLYGIPDDAFVVCYIGRHNQIKGYDTLVDAAGEILANPSTWVLVAGNPGPVKAPRRERWVEAGWTNDPHSLITAADVFILPNRETYFDLVMLEVLSLGQVVLASRTGGNKYFEQFRSRGIRLYDGVDGLLQGLVEICSADPEERKAWGAENERLFEEHFTLEKFARGYDRIMRDIVAS